MRRQNMWFYSLTKCLQELHLQLGPSQSFNQTLKDFKGLPAHLSEFGVWFQISALSYQIILVPNVVWFTLGTFML